MCPRLNDLGRTVESLPLLFSKKEKPYGCAIAVGRGEGFGGIADRGRVVDEVEQHDGETSRGLRRMRCTKWLRHSGGHSLVYGRVSEIRERTSTVALTAADCTVKRLIPMLVVDRVALVPVRGSCRL
jgi:hypothetical protein